MLKKFTVIGTGTGTKAETEKLLSEALGFIRESLGEMKLSVKDTDRAVLMCEETMTTLLKHADFSELSHFVVNIGKVFGDVIVDIKVPGNEFDFYGNAEVEYHADDDDDDELSETQAAVQSILLRSFSRYLRYKHYRRFNTVRIKAMLSNYSGLYKILTILFTAVVSGVVLKEFFPENVCMAVNNNIFTPVRTVFMNGLKMCSVPVVLFSIITCLSGMGNTSGLQKSGGKLLKYIVLFQTASTAIAFGSVYLFGTGKGVRLTASSSVEAVQAETLSLTGMLMNLVPENIVRPLLEADMLQIMVIAVIIGISVGVAGAKILRDVFGELTAVFMRATRIFMLIVPLAIFCSIASMVITTGLETIVSVIGILLTFIFAYVLLNIFMCIAVKLSTGLSPFVMLRKSLPVIITAFSTCSSIAAIPDGMKCCEDMGISRKVYSLSIPLTTSICKAGFPITFAILTLSGANMYGVEMSVSSLISLAFSIIVLTVSTPGLPGAGIISMSALFTQTGCPLEFLGIAISTEALEDLFNTPTTCMGNIACTVIAADGGNMIDREKYNS